MANNETNNQDNGLWGRLMGEPGGGLGSLAANPLFNMGMGLLQARYDRDVNPFEAASRGLLSAVEQQRKTAQEERAEQGRQDFMQFLQTGQWPGGGQPPADVAMYFADPNRPSMSPVPGMEPPQMSFMPPSEQGLAAQMAPTAQQQMQARLPPSQQQPMFQFESPELNRFYEDAYWDMALGK